MAKGKSALSIVRKYFPSITRVTDARDSLDVEVLAKDCKSGKAGEVNDCAMARACKRQFDGAIISKAIAYLIKGNVATRFRVPSSLQREIVSFDRNHDFRPGSYYLAKPYTTEKLLWRRDARSGTTSPIGSPDKPVKVVRRSHKTDGLRSL